MIIFYTFLISSVLSNQVIPFKPNDQFEIKLQYEFKQRPAREGSSLTFNADRKDERSVLPYLILHVKILKLGQEETRIKLSKNMGSASFNKRIEENMEFEIDMGFTDDMKDRVSSYEYNIHFLTAKKQELSHIVIFVDKDGTFLVNGEKRGKF